MKKTILIAIVLTVELFASSFVKAQGTLYVSNLGQTPTGSATIGSDDWIAQTFITGTNPRGYVLNSIQLLMDAASGTPSGFTVSLYSKTGDPSVGQFPGDSPLFLSNLNGSVNPSTSGLFTYAASGLTLSASTFYYVVVTGAMPVAQGAYNWSAANSYTEANGWLIDNEYFSSANGSSWTWVARQDVFQMAIYATPVPEPATGVLFAISLAYFGLLRLRQTK